MRGIVVKCPSKEEREDFVKSFLLSIKKSKTKKDVYTFSDNGEETVAIELNDCKGAVSVAMIMIHDHIAIKISGVGEPRLDPVVVPDGATVFLGGTL